MQESSAPLARLRVIELHAIGPVPFVGMQLARLGATVTRISPPTDPTLGIDSGSVPDPLHHNKSTHRLDLKTREGQDALTRLLDDADVLLEGFRPGVFERLLGEPAQLKTRYPTLILGRLSGFGRLGPHAACAGHDINYLALSGVLHSIGTTDSPAVPLNLIGDFGGGAMHLLMGILALLVRRGITGEGGVADTSILAGTHGLTPMIHGLLAGGIWQDERHSNLLDGGAPFYSTYGTCDQQHVAVGALEPRFYSNLVEVLQLTAQLPVDAQYDESTWPEQRQLLTDAFAARTRHHWQQLGLQVDCCLTPVLNWHEAVHDEHTMANAWFDDHAIPTQLVTFN